LKTTAVFPDFLKKKLEYVVAFLSFLLFLGISLTVPGQKTEYGMYDTLMAIKPAVPERNDILMIDIDDPAIEQIGAWPWSRDVIADVLIRLREVGGKRAVFDIEYLTPGQAGVNRSFVKTEFPAEYSGVRNDILQYLKDFSDAIASKNISVSDVKDAGSQMSDYIDQQMKTLEGSITGHIFRDNDDYFAKALHYFGHAYLTINNLPINTNADTKPAIDYARSNLMFTNVVDKKNRIARETTFFRQEETPEKGISPAILPLLSKAYGAGFPNVIIDSDGVRRRIQLLTEYQGAYIGQLVFSPILGLLEPEKIIRNGQQLILVNALDPKDPEKGIRKNITIPLDEHGLFLINWLKKFYNDPKKADNTSFRHISIYAVKRCDEMEDKLIENLTSIEALGIKNAAGYLSYYKAVTDLHSSYRDLSVWKQGLLDGTRSDYDAYFTARTGFFSSYGKFLDGGYDTEIYATFDDYTKLSGDTLYAIMKSEIQNYFDIYRKEYKAFLAQFEKLSSACGGSFCIIGNTGTGSTDLGKNPFWKSYPNVGTHANIYNTVMNEQFIYPLPRWASWLFALLLCLLSALAYRKIKSLKFRIFYGMVSSISVFVIISFLFAVFRIYIEVFVPLLSVIVTFLAVSILRFVFSEQEKSFLRKAFTMYLSSDVVNEIVADPSRLKLGGQEKQITALFTDIKSFSTLSEKVTPEHLVQILNKYLTEMSDLILAQKGTIDKYIGDAIVSFFGAPLDLPDHASRACLAAVRMKQAEARLNEQLMASGEIPSPIYTRIGINSGPMVVGNMGTDNKMNYTIMGNEVNLAARLEGVNKMYATWILVSESTWSQTNGEFLGRKLDRVRVVGINTPVQLYNILAVRAEASGKMLALAEKFNTAVTAYHEKRFSDALILFSKCTEIDPDDAASVIFRDRMRDLLKNGIPADWSDVINMTSK
jgi:adenylate cyclase